MNLKILKQVISLFDEKKKPTQNKKQKQEYNDLVLQYNQLLIKYNHLKKRFRNDQVRIDKTKYLCTVLRPLMEKVEKQNIHAVNAFLSQPPLRNLFVDFFDL